MVFSPGFLLLILFFLLSPAIFSGKLSEKSTEAIASLIGAVLTMVPVLIVYFIIISIIRAIF